MVAPLARRCRGPQIRRRPRPRRLETRGRHSARRRTVAPPAMSAPFPNSRGRASGNQASSRPPQPNLGNPACAFSRHIAHRAAGQNAAHQCDSPAPRIKRRKRITTQRVRPCATCRLELPWPDARGYSELATSMAASHDRQSYFGDGLTCGRRKLPDARKLEQCQLQSDTVTMLITSTVWCASPPNTVRLITLSTVTPAPTSPVLHWFPFPYTGFQCFPFNVT